MARNKIFISYSHQDEKFFKELLVHLKPWQDRGILDVWTDLRIHASQKWHEEIQQAVHSTAVAVLLISPDFMASDYIQKQELPPFLKAAEERQLALACLYLRPSQAANDYVYTVILDSGESKAVKLSDYQALNKPDEVLKGKLPVQRDKLFGKAVQQITDLYKQYIQEGRPKPPSGGQRHELTIRLEISDKHLFRTFYSQHTRLATGYSVWPPSSDPRTALYETLFGAGQDDKTTEVLQPLFPQAANPTPLFSPVRVRIQTKEPSLAELPWTQTKWNGKRLWDKDTNAWTFELVSEATNDEIAAFPTLHLYAPCPVLLIAPGSATSGESHLLALEDRLDHAWPAYRERHPQPIRTRVQLKEGLHNYRPCIVYYYGPADGDSKNLQLHLDDGSLDITELPQLWQRPPQIVFLNLLQESPIGLGNVLAPVHAHVPLVVAQTWSRSDCDRPRQSAKNWFLELLQNKDLDPIELLHKHGLDTVQIWGRYGQWRYDPLVVSPREKLARLLLDRENQRGAVQRMVSTLVHDSGRRLSCLLAFGGVSDMVHLFVEQLLEYLRRYSKRDAHILPVRLSLPPAETFDVDQVKKWVQRLFNSETLRQGLEKHKRPTPDQRIRLVLLLDWGVRGTEDTLIDDKGIEAWVEFCAKYLCEQCPPDMRLLSILALQSPRGRQDHVTAQVKRLRTDSRFATQSFRMEHVQPLGDVGEDDLMAFLTDGHTSCPQEQISDMSKLICQKTQGRFNETVELIEEAENVGVRGWLELPDKIKKIAAA